MNLFTTLKLADYVTLMNAVCGVLSIYFSLSNNLPTAAALIMFAVFFDFLDGKVARLSGSSPLGKDLDSLSDVVSFGVAPAIFMMSFYPSYFSVIAGILLVLAGILRLARFNISEFDGGYEGMPITFNGLIFPLLFFFHIYVYNIPYIVFPIVMVLSSILMVSSVRIKKIF